MTTDTDIHILETTGTDWSLQHPLSCRPNLLDCPYHTASKRLIESSFAPGLWVVQLVKGELVRVRKA